MNEYSLLDGTKQAIQTLLDCAGSEIPPEAQQHLENVSFSTRTNYHQIYFPCPFRETEAAAALKAVEASTVAAIADIRFGRKEKRKIDINFEKTAAFLFSAYIATIGGLGKQDPGVKEKLKDTDLNQAQSILYRRLSANLYRTKTPNQYYHVHGSLEASTTLKMLGLEPYRPDLTDYHQCIATIEQAVQKFSIEELEEMNARERQAGVMALKWDEFRETEHGKALVSQPPWKIEMLEMESPPVAFPSSVSNSSSEQLRPLAGIKVLELCRIIAGPAIGRTLAEYGATVLKITSPNLPDVPFFQVDGNTGKHCADLDLKGSVADRKRFEELLLDADMVLDGYRAGALEKLGYGVDRILEIIKGRGKGIIYVSEDCFGPNGPWSNRPGWQQIADCVSGVAWSQGQFMSLNEPIVPPFPMSDYGTGCMGAISALTAILNRSIHGGSYIAHTSILQYDIFLQKLGLYPPQILEEIKKKHDAEFFENLRHADSVDVIGGMALKSMRRCHPEFFDDGPDGVLVGAWSKGYGEVIKWVGSAVEVEGVRVGFERASRPNGFDEAGWEGWEVDEELVRF